MAVVETSVGVEGTPDPATRTGAKHPLLGFLLRRVSAGLATLLVASFFIFFATNVLPGNVASVVLGRDATPANVAQLDRRLNLDHPLLVRYWSWLSGVATGNLGQSAVQLAQGATNAPVASAIATPVVNSLILAGITIVLMIPLSIGLGVVAGLRSGRPTDHVISLTTLVIGAFPEFVFGALLILIFFTELKLLPPVALLPPGEGPLDHVTVLVLPVLTLLGVTLASGIRQVRGGIIDVLQRDYVVYAEINGVPRRRLLWRYALRNTLAPSVQIAAQNIQYLLGGIIIVESVFDYPGLGSFLVNAVTERDVPEVEAIAIMLAAVYIAINILADLIVVFLVPKLRTEDLMTITLRWPRNFSITLRWPRFARLATGRVGLLLLVLILGLAVFGPLFAPHSPDAPIGIPASGPSRAAPLGTDYLGRDILSRVLDGGLSVVLLAGVAIALIYLVGITVGLVAGYSRSLVDPLLMRCVDFFLSFPAMLLLLVLVTGLGTGTPVLIFGVVIVLFPGVARIVRTATLEASGRGYVEAAVARGERMPAVLFREILPNIVTPIMADLGIRFSAAVIFLSSLTYLGLGLKPPSSNWGLMISENQEIISANPWSVLVPAVLLGLVTVSVNLVADSYARTRGRSGA